MSWHDRHTLVPAVYVLVEKDGLYLMIRRYNTGFSDGNYTFPAGHLDGNEPPSSAAAREALEEVGVTVRPEDLEVAHIMVYKAIEGTHERVSLFFRAKRYSGDPINKEPHKADDMQWFSGEALPDNIVWEVKHAFEQIRVGKIYSELNY